MSDNNEGLRHKNPNPRPKEQYTREMI